MNLSIVVNKKLPQSRKCQNTQWPVGKSEIYEKSINLKMGLCSFFFCITYIFYLSKDNYFGVSRK